MIATKIQNMLLHTNNIQRSAVIWNALSAMMNSFQTMVLLMVITHFGTVDDSAIFVMAYAVGNLMLNVGKYGVRQFQVTDTYEKYSFAVYRRSRVVSTVLMLVFSVVYIVYNVLVNAYTFEKSAVILVICASKAVEAYEDVYHGRMQQLGRLDVAAKILGVRLTVFVAGCAVLFVVTRHLLLTVVVNLVVTVLLAVVLNRIAMKGLHADDPKRESDNMRTLLWECFPLCACMCMNMYIANAPKYVIDTAVSAEVQTNFNIVFMPVFVIALLANFVFQPYLKSLGDIWNCANMKSFVKKIGVLAAVVVAICAAVTVVGAWIGDDVLGVIYGVDLDAYTDLLLVFMICGGVIALQNLFIMAITVVRYQKYMIYGYAVTSLIMLTLGGYVLAAYDVLMLSLFFLLTMVFLLMYCVVLLMIAVQKNKDRSGDNHE